MISKAIIAISLVTSMLLLSGCLVTPKPMTGMEIRDRINQDLITMHKDQEKVLRPITLNEATARALRYNLDYRLKMMEEALYDKSLQLSQFDMLPKLIASAGYTDRDNDSGGSSMSLLTRTESLEPSTSQEKSRWTTGAAFSWNILDFGISYYRAKQSADQYLISQERKRKVIQNVIQDVRSAYYRALAAEKLVNKCDELLSQVNGALKSSEEIELKGLTPPAQSLNYQRALLETTNLLVQKRREMNLARTELAALMNLTPGEKFTIADTTLPEPLPTPTDLEKLEITALELRPELREEDYKNRISQDEAKRLLVSVMPGIELDAGFQYDSNKYLYNQNWLEYGARASWNLTKLLSIGKLTDMSDMQDEVNKVRRAALTMAVITQVRIGLQRYDIALFDYDLSTRASKVDDKLLTHSQSGAKVGFENELEVIRANTRAILSEIMKYTAYANVQAAYARLLNSLGMDLLPPVTELKDISSVAEYMNQNLASWDMTIKGFSKPVATEQTIAIKE